MIDLAPHHLETVRRILREYVPACEVRAFGSRVDWTAKDYSDFDLAVVGSGKLDDDTLRHLREAFEESDLPFRVEVLDWHAISPDFQKVIEKEYEVIQGVKSRSEAGDWRETTLGDVVRLQRGHDLPEQERQAGTIPIVGSFGITGWHNEPRAKGPGVTIGRSGASIGVVSYVERDYWPLNTCLYVTDFRGNDPRFCYYWLKTLGLALYNSGSAQPSLNRNYIYDMPVRVPDSNEQRAIAHVLGTLDDKIELNRRMNETLEAIARALFESWFVDFDPVRAKVKGRDPGLPKRLADLFPDSFEDSVLGETPKSWRVGSFLESAKLLSGGTPKTDREDYWGGDILWASAKDVSQCSETFIIATERTITEKGLAESATQLIPAFCTVVVARGATTGRMALLGREMAMNQTCYALEGLTGTPFVLYCQLLHEMERLVQGAHGSVFDTITTSTFAGSTILLPPKQILGHLERLVTPLFMRVLVNVWESHTLSRLRDALLPKLISGEIRVKA